MSGSGGSFGEDIAAFEDVRQLESTDYLCEYIGVLADTDEQVRIITLSPELTDVDTAVDAFAQVSDRWYNASANANVRTIHDRSTEPRPWIAVPDHGGNTLATLQPDLSPDAIETVISETADALRTLGLYNTVHGHLSPDDIYLPDAAEQTETPSVHVGGFGLEAAIQAAVGEFEPTAYTAPELLDSPGQSTELTDVYGLAAITYFALTGSPPVEGDDLGLAIRDGVSSPPSACDDAIPADLDDVVVQALETQPADRYDSPYAFGRAFLSIFAPDDFRPEDTGEESDGEAEAAESAASGKETSDQEDNDSPSDDDNDSTASDETDQTSVTRRAAVGLLGVGALGGAGWYLSRGQLTAADQEKEPTADQAEEPITDPAEETVTPDLPAEPSASISAEPADPFVGEEVTISATESTTGEGVSIGTYEWAVGTDAAFTEDDPTRTHSFAESGEHTVRVRVTDTRGRTATARATVQVRTQIGGAPMYQYNAANTGYVSGETGPTTPITTEWVFQAGESVTTSPAVVDGTVYIGNWDETVYALDAVDGTQQWEYITGGLSTGLPSSPAVMNGTLYIGDDFGVMHALDTESGTQQWQIGSGDRINASPTVTNGSVYFANGEGTVYGITEAEGDFYADEWSIETGARIDGSPAVVDGIMYLGNFDGTVYALSSDDGAERWNYQINDVIQTSPTVADDTIYVGSNDNSLYALDVDDGTLQWRFESDGSVDLSPVVANNTVYVGSDGTIYALDTSDGTQRWSSEIGEYLNSSPVVADGTIYVTKDANGAVVALDTADGTEQWTYETGDTLASSPVVVNGHVYVGSRNGTVYALTEQ